MLGKKIFQQKSHNLLESLGTFKYHMTLKSVICSNRQSAVIWGRRLAKSSYNFYSSWKSL